ncbi:hypothetical protein [Bacillus benzoevorans]|uniref:Uncharacterized protein n=1 Tax=Bacillus benzoevorans TaxID=1456 RepID=A0A7X0HQZ4_9BACI|nr:hypothetical protein [Bacillus benzoevorans]MBB6444020.1 hypothetical protein [Bacillus benzoevorans]
MSLEWFDRVCGDLQEQLESICEEYDQVGQMKIERSAKHPRIEFFVETADIVTEELERDYFCTLFFDPENEEFYIESFDVDSGHPAKIILTDIEEIVAEVHDSLHDYFNDEGYELSDVEHETVFADDHDEEYYEGLRMDDGNIFEEIDVEWTTPEVTAFQHEDEVEVTYQFGVIQESGDGVLKRVNRVWSTDDELIKDESHFIFSKEEASTIIAMIASNMEQLSAFDEGSVQWE